MERSHEAESSDTEEAYEDFESDGATSDLLVDSDREASATEVDNILHNCSYCPELKANTEKHENEERILIRAILSLTVSELYDAAAHGCKFLQRLVGPAQALISQRSSMPASRLELLFPAQVDILEMGAKLSLGDKNSVWNEINVELNWGLKEGSYAYPGIYHIIDDRRNC
jgi:hypothetical protein